MDQERLVLDIPIFHKAYDLYKLLDNYHHRIPKTHRYTLWLRCEDTTLVILEAIIAVTHRRGEERIDTLHAISHKVDLLKVLIRLAKETRAIDDRQYLAIQTIVQEIGRMVGGWLKSVPH